MFCNSPPPPPESVRTDGRTDVRSRDYQIFSAWWFTKFFYPWCSAGALRALELRYKKPGKLPTHWTSEVPTKWKRNCITRALHRAKTVSTNLDRDIKEIKTTFLNAGYPKKFLSCTIDNFESSKSSEDESLIPDFLFEERKKICMKLPYCKKNEITSKKFISKLNSFTNFRYIFIILWQTRQIKSLFSLKDKNLHKSHVIYEGERSCGENHVGETMRNLEVRITEHSNICHTSEPVESPLFCEIVL